MVIFMKEAILNFNQQIKKYYSSITSKENIETKKIDISDVEVTKILDIDYKSLNKLKRDYNYILDQLNKSINDDIVVLYKKEFDKKHNELQQIRIKYQNMNNIFISDEDCKEVISYNKAIIKKITKLLSNILIQDENIKNELSNKKIKSKPKKVEQEEKNIDYIALIKTMNNSIDTYHKQLTIIKRQLIREKDKDELEKILYNLYWIKDKIVNVKKEYDSNFNIDILKKLKLNHSCDNVDNNKLIISSRAIESLLAICENDIQKVKDKNLLKNTQQKKINKIVKNEKAKEKYIVDKKELQLISSSIIEDLDHTKEEMSKIRNFVSKANPKLRDKAFINGVTSFTKNTIKMIDSMFPTTLFKNRYLGNITSCVLINNRIRLMRKLISNQKKEMLYMEYKNVVGQVENKDNCLVTTKNVIDNSIDQLEKLILEVDSRYYENDDGKLIIMQLEKLKLEEINKKEEIINSIKENY